ncbi:MULTISPECIES: hypothetical protein [Paraburkholderia]|uniref:Peptidase n=1 Tax=Paraburkholderia podalyriae TaxID=1938811 RepID=A0ABR7PVZ2_9BURK|nr:hypothetical protein [Paraburkholderia podalyriae]MBC8750449.1 hypothetical protein [Paraburkholderia podalyriae]
MLICTGQLAIASIVVSVCLTLVGCKEKPVGERQQETVSLPQLPPPVKATIDQQAQGRTIGEIEKQTARGTTRYAVALGSRDQKQELLIDESGKVVATNAGEEDDD